MHSQSGSEENSATGVTLAPAQSRMPWRVAGVEVLPAYKLRVRFLDGLEGTVDMNALVHSAKAGVFAALADPEHFGKAYVNCGVVTWPGDIDLAPDTMHAAIKQSGSWIL